MSQKPLTFNLSGCAITDYVDLAGAHLDVGVDRHQSESTVVFPDWFGSGTLRRVQVREGVEVCIGDMQPATPLTLTWDLELRQPLLELHFHLAGCVTTIFDGDTTHYTLRSGQVGQSYLGASRFSGRSLYPAQQQQRMVELTLHAPAFAHLSALETLLPAAHPFGMERHFLNRCMLPELQLVAQQILDCSFVGSARSFYLEAKALELMALALVTASKPCDGCSCRLRPTDLEKIYAARDLILAQIDAPPSLLELARAVGLNDFKLKTGFKQVFGTTVFGYLHQQRMQRARTLLLEGRHNVLDVALSVGYASPSRFAAAFKQTFGMLPSALQRSTL